MDRFPPLGVLAGRVPSEQVLQALCDQSPWIVAADGGADALLAVGRRPHQVVGDLDSLSPEGRAELGPLQEDPDQETTDCDKLLASLKARGDSRVILTGVEGDLPDHTLATIHSSARSGMDVWFVFARGFGRVVGGENYGCYHSKIGDRFSVIPLTICESVTIKGAKWPLTNARLSPMGGSGVSNRSDAEEVSVKISSGAAFLFFETSEEPIRALMASIIAS